MRIKLFLNGFCGCQNCPKRVQVIRRELFFFQDGAKYSHTMSKRKSRFSDALKTSQDISNFVKS